MSKEILRGRKAIMAALKICDERTFYRIRHLLPIRRLHGILIAEKNALVDAYYQLGEKLPAP